MLPGRAGGLLKPHVILIADAGPEIGWGHAVRQLALAEALCERGVRTLFVTRTREALALDWPCPVQVVDGHPHLPAATRTVVCDDPTGFERCDSLRAAPVVFMDYGMVGDAPDLAVCPNFAATSFPWGYPALLGPRWAPLRSEFATRALEPRNENRTGIFVYGNAPALPKECQAVRPTSMNAKVQAKAIAGCTLAVVPPSMVALECLALGTPVVLHVPGPKWQPIADAMVQAGVAEIWSGAPDDYTLACVLADDGKRRRMAEAGREAVDGRGSERLVEWLADA
jgi:spore coat polysaccharide biosynthesis predicted glycosyltransferase SpsG